jgi:LuxR family maltose regulon positive regulatory protein
MEQRLAQISGSQRHILDYLVAAVLATQAGPLQTFLLQTTGLVRLTGSLCDTVTGRADSTLLLEQIARANLFLLPLDESGTWYRYHALFAEAMQHEAHRRLGEASLLAIASKASRWYEQHDLLSDAVEAALRARELRRAAGLMTRIVESQHLLHHQELHTFLRWLKQFPEEILRESPTLSQTYAMALLFTTQQRTLALRPQFEAYLHMGEQRLRTVGDLPRLGEALALHALLSGHVNDHATEIRCAREALKILPHEERIWRSLALDMLGMAALVAGRMTEARQIMHESWKLDPVPFEKGNARRSGSLIQQGYWAVVKKGGMLISVASPPSPEQASKHGVRSVWFIVEPNREQLIQIGALIDAGHVRPIIETILPLSQARQAYEQGARGHTRGKIVLHVAD